MIQTKRTSSPQKLKKLLTTYRRTRNQKHGKINRPIKKGKYQTKPTLKKEHFPSLDRSD